MALPNRNRHCTTVAQLVEFLRGFPQDDTVDVLLSRKEVKKFLQPLFRTSGPASAKSRSNGFVANLKRIQQIKEFNIPESISSRFQIWKESPSSFWEQAYREVSTRSDQFNETSHRENVIHDFLTRAFEQDTWLEFGILHHRFNVEKFLEAACVDTSCTPKCAKIIRGGRYRKKFGEKLQDLAKQDPEGIDYGPLFVLDLPDPIWDGKIPFDGRALDEALSLLHQAGISDWTEKSGSRSLAGTLLKHQDDLLWNSSHGAGVANVARQQGKIHRNRLPTRGNKRQISREDALHRHKRPRLEIATTGSLIRPEHVQETSTRATSREDAGPSRTLQTFAHTGLCDESAHTEAEDVVPAISGTLLSADRALNTDIPLWFSGTAEGDPHGMGINSADLDSLWSGGTSIPLDSAELDSIWPGNFEYGTLNLQFDPARPPTSAAEHAGLQIDGGGGNTFTGSMFTL
ncbi:hypothetical protein HRG_007196 [Hirsutella rhossiliensis]|uniref:Uncharacterized protein n=1 Tax=Hirsutella rhossiliensis TaxID=111463 RepID=A0A9P8SGT0_9HYPO|nr:uncharacterized protein HRG_07196 [Hirsutella rhossiliensis]KAH0962116.1 hypothetical protein HRG_07196 [Hirsutella rhossiliensis]